MSNFKENGKIDSVFLPELITEIYNLQKSGVLELNSFSRLKIYFDNGTPFYAEGGEESTYLARILLDRNKLTNEQYENIVKEINDSDLRAGEIVVSMGILTPHELNDFLEIQINEKIILGLTYTSGDFDFREGSNFPENTFYCRLNTHNIVFETIRRYVDISHINAKEIRIHRKEGFSSEIVKLSLGPGELRIAQLLNKNSQPSEIIGNENIEEDRVITLVFFLTLCGLVEIENISVKRICLSSFEQMNKNKHPDGYEDSKREDLEIIDLEEEIDQDLGGAGEDELNKDGIQKNEPATESEYSPESDGITIEIAQPDEDQGVNRETGIFSNSAEEQIPDGEYSPQQGLEIDQDFSAKPESKTIGKDDEFTSAEETGIEIPGSDINMNTEVEISRNSAEEQIPDENHPPQQGLEIDQDFSAKPESKTIGKDDESDRYGNPEEEKHAGNTVREPVNDQGTEKNIGVQNNSDETKSEGSAPSREEAKSDSDNEEHSIDMQSQDTNQEEPDAPVNQSEKSEPDNTQIKEISEFYDFASEENNSFRILGVNEDADDAEVKEAYFRLVKKFHPDANPNFPREIRNKAETIFTKVTQAYESIATKAARDSYHSLKDADQIKDKAQAIYEAEVMFTEGELLLRQRRYKEASDKFSRAVELNPGEAAYIGALSWSRYLSYDNKESIIKDSIKELEKAISMNQNIAENFYYLGSLYKHTDDTAQAEKNFSRAVEIDPNYIQAKRELRLLKNRKQDNKQEKSKSGKGSFWSSLFKK